MDWISSLPTICAFPRDGLRSLMVNFAGCFLTKRFLKCLKRVKDITGTLGRPRFGRPNPAI